MYVDRIALLPSCQDGVMVASWIWLSVIVGVQSVAYMQLGTKKSVMREAVPLSADCTGCLCGESEMVE